MDYLLTAVLLTIFVVILSIVFCDLSYIPRRRNSPPTKDDIEELSKQVDELKKNMEQEKKILIRHWGPK